MTTTPLRSLRVYPVSLQEHVDHPRGSVAPVHQQVSVVPDAGRVVPRGELEATDVVDAGLHQPVDMLLHADEAWLGGVGAEEEEGLLNDRDNAITWLIF